jgi:plastocyanin
MRKSIVALVALAIALTGCGGESAPPGDSAGATTAPPVATAAPPAPADTPAPTVPATTPAPTTATPATGDTGDTAAGDPAPTPDGADTAGAGTAVTIEGFAFAPSQVDVTVSGEVTWTNRDSVSHTVKFDDRESSGLIASDDTFALTFSEPGSYDYVCELHADMSGTVVVE